jgi:hypothetical protein
MSYTDRNKAINNKMEKINNKYKNYKNKEKWEMSSEVMELKRLAKRNVSNLVELASSKRNVITKMDGRDQARINTIEAKGKVKVYTVSLQVDHHFDKTRHCGTNFNDRWFIDSIKNLCPAYSLSQVREHLFLTTCIPTRLSLEIICFV